MQAKQIKLDLGTDTLKIVLIEFFTDVIRETNGRHENELLGWQTESSLGSQTWINVMKS